MNKMMPHNRDKTHCKRGHEFTPENTYLTRIPSGRKCRKCASMLNKRRYQELKRIFLAELTDEK